MNGMVIEYELKGLSQEALGSMEDTMRALEDQHKGSAVIMEANKRSSTVRFPDGFKAFVELYGSQIGGGAKLYLEFQIIEMAHQSMPEGISRFLEQNGRRIAKRRIYSGHRSEVIDPTIAPCAFDQMAAKYIRK